MEWHDDLKVYLDNWYSALLKQHIIHFANQYYSSHDEPVNKKLLLL